MATENSGGWLGGFGDTLGKLGEAAGGFWGAYQKGEADNKNAKANQTAAKAQLLSAENMRKALPWVIGGIVLIVGLTFLRPGKK